MDAREENILEKVRAAYERVNEVIDFDDGNIIIDRIKMREEILEMLDDENIEDAYRELVLLVETLLDDGKIEASELIELVLDFIARKLL